MPKIISRAVFNTIEDMLKAGDQTRDEIADSHGVTSSIVCRIAKGKHPYQLGLKKPGPRKPYMPTPEEIKAKCELLRAARDSDTWPEAQGFDNYGTG